MAQHSAHDTRISLSTWATAGKKKVNSMGFAIQPKEKTGCHRIFQKAPHVGQGDHREEILGHCWHLEVQGDPQGQEV